MLQVLTATDAIDASTQLLDLDSAEAIDALIAGKIDVAIFASQLDTSFLHRALGAPGLRLMNVAQAEAIAKTVPGLKHLVLSRGIISLIRDIPNSDIDLLASRNSLLVRKGLHPALQYFCWKRCAKSIGHRAPLIGSVNSLPSNQMTCHSLRRQRHFTAPARASGNGTRPSGYVTPQPNRVLYHSGRRGAHSRHWLRASLIQMVLRPPYRSIAPSFRNART
jgi:hypothetical protein